MDGEQIALAVGRIVMRAAWVDEACADLAVESQRARGEIHRELVGGSSGKPLAEQMRLAGAGQWADEYMALYERRNAVVHGRWYTDPQRTGGLQTYRTQRRKPWIAPAATTNWSAESLDAFVSDLEAFYQRVVDEVMDLAGIPRGWPNRPS